MLLKYLPNRQKDSEIGTLKGDAENLQSEFDASKSDSQSLINDLKEKNEAELSKLKEQLDQALKDTEVKNGEIENHSNTNVALQQQLESQKSEHEQNAKDKDSQIDKLQARVDELEAELEKTKFDLTQANTEKDQDDLQKSVDELNKHLDMAREEISGLTEENTTLKDRIAELESAKEEPEEDSSEKPAISTEVPIENFVNEETDIKKFVEAHLKHYDVDMPVTADTNPSTDGFYNLKIGEKAIPAKVVNNKFYVKGGGGWYPLDEYIEKYVIKMYSSKKRKSPKGLTFKNLLGKKTGKGKLNKTKKKDSSSLSNSGAKSRPSATSSQDIDNIPTEEATIDGDTITEE